MGADSVAVQLCSQRSIVQKINEMLLLDSDIHFIHDMLYLT